MRRARRQQKAVDVTIHIRKNRDGYRGLSSVSASNGLTLIEVLIALLVLSIGLVGLASVHLLSLKAAHSSYYRSLAATAALDAEEQAWSLMADNLSSADPYGSTSTVCVNQLVSNFSSTLESSIQTAWIASADSPQAGIPGLQVTVADIPSTIPSFSRLDTDNGGTWTDRYIELPLSLSWTETRFGGEATESFDFVVRIPCISTYQP